MAPASASSADGRGSEMPTERQSVAEGDILSLTEVMSSDIEDRSGVTTLPIGLRVEHRTLPRIEPPLPSEPATARPMKDHRPSRSYRFASVEQRERVERAAAQAGMTLGQFIESNGGRS